MWKIPRECWSNFDLLALHTFQAVSRHYCQPETASQKHKCLFRTPSATCRKSTSKIPPFPPSWQKMQHDSDWLKTGQAFFSVRSSLKKKITLLYPMQGAGN